MAARSARLYGGLAVAVAGLVGMVTYAAEHPAEHPVEHPIDGTPAVQQAALTKEQLARVIRLYVDKDAALKGGYFLVYDQKNSEPLVLTLVLVHKDRLASVGPQEYFACADFKTPAGKLYDLDISMRGPDQAHLEVTEISIHKEAGKERYTWHSDGGIWQKRPVG
jgi:hypothetical protein